MSKGIIVLVEATLTASLLVGMMGVSFIIGVLLGNAGLDLGM